jgi:predicted CXXCH cytochrome family protein
VRAVPRGRAVLVPAMVLGCVAATAALAHAEAPGATPPARPVVLCGVCHPEARVQFEQGVHRAEGFDCTSCHGGDGAASTVQGAHRSPFRGKPKRREIPALCAECHADLARMTPYNIPADQYALYLTSQHGRRLAKGDESVAVCTDCHGAHEIRRKDDPKSRVFARNVPATCGRCHGAPPAGSPDGTPAVAGSPLAEYQAGVHGQAFLVQANDAAPTCASCHGSHGAAPPGVGDGDKVCGQCHATARGYYREGPHARALRAGNGPECANCHGNHAIGRAGTALLDTICAACHEAGSPMLQVAASMKTLFTGAQEEIGHARALVETAAAIPLYVEDYQARLEEAHTSLVQASPVVHTLDVARVRQLTDRARGIAKEVESEINGKLGERWWRRVGLLLFWFYLGLTLAILVVIRRRALGEAGR